MNIYVVYKRWIWMVYLFDVVMMFCWSLSLFSCRYQLDLCRYNSNESFLNYSSQSKSSNCDEPVCSIFWFATCITLFCAKLGLFFNSHSHIYGENIPSMIVHFGPLDLNNIKSYLFMVLNNSSDEISSWKLIENCHSQRWQYFHYYSEDIQRITTKFIGGYGSHSSVGSSTNIEFLSFH